MGFQMNLESWNAFRDTLPKGPFYASKQDLERFEEFVKQAERIPLLLHAYDRYRVATDPREISCYSILISTILASGIKPDHREAAEILRRSFHRCGHGSDVEPPVTLAEKAFRDRPYSNDLFDSALVYRETLRVSRGSVAQNVKRKLSWMLWHDARRIEKKCHARRIQQAIHAMDPKSAFHWQWLLRNTSAGLNSAPGKTWIKEGTKRLAKIGTEAFLSRLDEWFTFPEGEANLSAAGSAMLRLLVWYGALVDAERSLPVLVRLANVSWSKRAPEGKVMGALAWVLRTYGELRFEAAVQTICRRWVGESAEVKRLEGLYFPDISQIRKDAEQAAREKKTLEFEAKVKEQQRLLREKYPHVFGPEGTVERLRAARELVEKFGIAR